MGMGSQSLWIWALTLFFTMKKYGAIIDRIQLVDDGGLGDFCPWCSVCSQDSGLNIMLKLGVWRLFSQKLDHLANAHSLQKCRRYCMVHFPEQIWTDPKKVGVKIEETISVEPITVSFSWILGKPRSLATTRGKEIWCWMAVDMESDRWFFISNISKIWTQIWSHRCFHFLLSIVKKGWVSDPILLSLVVLFQTV
jgi:hypothetical protein